MNDIRHLQETPADSAVADAGKETLLELKGISTSFGTTDVLKDIDLSIERGEFITFLGASGCGKTTTLRIIAGLEMPDKGQVILEGRDVTMLEPHQRDVNTVFQNYALFPHMNVEANIGYGLRIRKVPKNEIREKVKKMLDLVQLSGYEKRMPSELSGGQKQRVAIAGVMAMRPRCIVLDEPTAMLDPNGRKEVLEAVHQLNRQEKVTVVLITHYMEEVIDADHVYVMDEGHVVMEGTPGEIFSQVDMLKKYRLDVPQVTLLAHELKKSGVDIPDGILTTEELVNCLCQ